MHRQIKRGLVIWFVGLFGFLAIIIVLGRACSRAGGRGPESAQACQIASSPWFEAAALLRRFEENEVAANEELKGACVRAEGEVDSISDGVGGPTLRLRGSLAKGVRCSDISAADLARLHKGDRIEMMGTVSGQYWDVQLRDCRLVP